MITITGAESSGKTALCAALAEALSCEWIPEYARMFLTARDGVYQFEDLNIMAQGQLHWINGKRDAEFAAALLDVPDHKPHTTDVSALADKVYEMHQRSDASGLPILLIDSGMLSFRMWARIKYQQEVPFVDEMMSQDPTNLYLLCRPIHDWSPDPLRESPTIVDRSWIFNQYLKELREMEATFLQVTMG